MSFEFDIPQKECSIIKVIGVGGGGSNAVSHMYKEGITGVEFAICNTDNQSMESSPVPTKIQLGPMLTDGRGAGSKPTVGKQACIESIDDVRVFLEDNTKMLFITAGMGGGTGTGAAPIIAKAAKDMGILTVGIVTIPFRFEGRTRTCQAIDGTEELRKNVDALIMISNDKLRSIYGNLALSEAFSKADNILTTAAKGIAEIITVSGYVNVDFEDVNTVMRESGVAIMGTATAEGEDRANEAVRMALNSQLLEEDDIRGAKHILLNITSGSKEVTMDEIGSITDYIQEEAGNHTNLIWGNSIDESLGDKLTITLIATGFDRAQQAHTEEMTGLVTERQIVHLDSENEEPETDQDVFELDRSDVSANTVEFNDLPISSGQPSVMSNKPYPDPFVSKNAPERIRQKTVQTAMPHSAGDKKIYSLQELTSENIKQMESVPTYERDQVQLREVPKAGVSDHSRFSITDDEEPILKQDNPYLYDNVD